ncbi:MAG: hypothetical protein A3K19_01590 [Lentisphaerae bacterium RIFOXYB12_FULL_65_16]|nr:MAG: hypothetical protein A3K18_02875 [Lentisphaerae bacterium RIFOXYA12_64_32]OGV92843.1 MAG: hypothetical protein A3K19_01590 [Lentisphaerae bacterium RIFOXYB12_FULL_65_16]
MSTLNRPQALAPRRKRQTPITILFAALFSCCVPAQQPAAPPAEQPAAVASATVPPQVPLCMIGDSITWAQEGDTWRQHLLAILPRLAFVGTHSAKLGYSHAGEGGNSTSQVLKRLADIPDCPYYSLLIGTNDNNLKDEAAIDKHTTGTADRVEQIVMGLLAKPSVKKVFLGSILPCHTDNPLRDRTNSATNVKLRERMKGKLGQQNVVWVEYEQPIRKIDGWEPMIQLHPTSDGYRVLAKILSDSIIAALAVTDPAATPAPQPGCGVRIENLWQPDPAPGQTRVPVIAGWYTISFEVLDVTGEHPTVTAATVGGAEKTPPPKAMQPIPVPTAEPGKRVSVEFFPGYEGYGYKRAVLQLQPAQCKLGRILFEKRRPSGQTSVYGEGSYLDTTTPPAPGELVEAPAAR